MSVSCFTQYAEAEWQPAATAINSLIAVDDSKIHQLTGRRQKLPVPKSNTEGINLWNLLCKNIGKDLSKISMPVRIALHYCMRASLKALVIPVISVQVTLNEPLSALQRLCEELEYSELLDKACQATSVVERMTWVAAFAVSCYGTCQARAGKTHPVSFIRMKWL